MSNFIKILVVRAELFHAERQRGGETNRRTDKQADRQTVGQTNRRADMTKLIVAFAIL
jgi:hypothetical protein